MPSEKRCDVEHVVLQPNIARFLAGVGRHLRPNMVQRGHGSDCAPFKNPCHCSHERTDAQLLPQFTSDDLKVGEPKRLCLS